MKRVLVLLAVSTMGVLAGVTAAEAQVLSNTSTSYAYAGFVPCAAGGAGELMTGTIDAHDVVTSTVNDNVDVWRFASELRGSLVGRVTGDTYRLTGVTHGTYTEGLQGDTSTATYVNRYELIGPGAGNNLVVRETAHVTRSGDDVVVRHDDLRIECS